RTITVPITSSVNETPTCHQPNLDQHEDELEQVLDDYEEEELSEIEAFMVDSQEEDEIDPISLDYNPWDEEDS
ncbi:3789_t:CDS:1, partial [Funneliformis geosporum]